MKGSYKNVAAVVWEQPPCEKSDSFLRTHERARLPSEYTLQMYVTLKRERLGNLILVQADKIAPDAPLTNWGMDSMLASEFRTWFFMAFAVDIPFLFIMGPTAMPKTLGEMVLAPGEFSIGFVAAV